MLSVIESGVSTLRRIQIRFRSVCGSRSSSLRVPDLLISMEERVDALYHDHEEWSRRAILNVAGMGRFLSDRTIREYAETVWKVKAVEH